MIHQPTWLDRSEYPFTSRTFEHPDGNLHYIDEGEGPLLFFVHGTPDWSFGFRHLIKSFRNTHRCVALDHLGFGLSDKPVGAEFTVADHARRLQDLIDHLGLKALTLVVTDFGGGIGLEHALRRPTNVKGIVLYNTWMWELMPDKRFARPTSVMNSGFGKFLYIRLGFSVNVMMPNGYGDKRRLTRSVHAHFKNALPDATSRAATFALVREIKNAGPFWNEQWARVGLLREIPTLLCWGMKDRFFPADLLERWRTALPYAMVQRFSHAGHFVHEEAGDALANAIRSWWI